MSFGNNLKELRKEKGLTQEQLAEMLDVSRQAVSKWESDSGYPETDKLLMIAKELEVSLDFLMDNQPPIQDATEEINFTPTTDNKIMITMFDKSQTVNCLSVKYSKISYPAKNEPTYILQGVDRIGFLGAHTVILGWYEDEETVKKELSEIIKAISAGEKLYELKYFTDVKFTALGTTARK